MSCEPHSRAMCPHCGYDLRLDTPILIDDFIMMSSMAPLNWRGQNINLTGSERIICYTLMKTYPLPVRLPVILDRLDSEATGNVVDVYICRIRRKLRDVGAPNPIKAVRNRGHGRVFTWVTGVDHDFVQKKAA